jgi:uncharacterized protein
MAYDGMNYEWMATHACNLKCPYCYEGEKTDRANTREVVEDYAEAIYALEKKEGRLEPGNTNALISQSWGGEALLRADLIEAFCAKIEELQERYRSDRNPFVIIPTNGTLLGEPNVARLLERYKSYIRLQVSIDGDRETHDGSRAPGTYDLILRNVSELFSRGHKMTAKATYFHKTVHRYASGVIALIEAGFQRITANVSGDEDWSSALDEEFLYAQMTRVVDYFLENDLIGKVNMPNILYSMRTRGDGNNVCTAGTAGLCLGFDRQLYICHRGALLPDYFSIGELKGKEIILREDAEERICHARGLVRAECRECPVSCPQCLMWGKKVCGYTKATTRSARYYLERLVASVGTECLISVAGQVIQSLGVDEAIKEA